MEANCTFSIIIPCYNAAKYLPTCLESVVRQAYPYFEIILVNDGSQDETAAICDSYHTQDSRITVVHKRNQGVSRARNDGMRLANNKYILFLDADDCMCEDLLDKLALQLSQTPCDVCVGAVMIQLDDVTQKTTRIVNFDSAKIAHQAHDDIIISILQDPNTLGIWAVWRHVYQRSFLLRENLFFDSSYAYAEDMDWFIQVLLKSEKISFYDEALCYYRCQHSSSVSTQYSLRSICNHIQVLHKWILHFDESDFAKEHSHAICERLANKQMAILNHLSHLSDEDREVALSYMKQHKESLVYVRGMKFQLTHYCCKIFGFKNTARLLHRKEKSHVSAY